MLEEKRKTILVMEDDVDVRPYFTKGLYNVLKEANKYAPSWDFMWVSFQMKITHCVVNIVSVH